MTTTALAIVFWCSLVAVVYSYGVYPVLLWIAARLFGRNVAADPSYTPRVGVVVPVYNEETVIRRKIENILAMDYPAERLSVWIGSDQSSDSTNDAVRSFGDPRVHLWIAPRRGGKTQVLNQLAPLVDAEILMFTDANTFHRPDSLRIMVAAYADASVGGVAGHIDHEIQASQEHGERFYRSFESRQKTLESRLHSTISAFGGFYTIRKSLFRQIPHNSYSNDDVLIPMNVIRQGYRMLFERRARSYEDMTENVALEFRRRVRIGAGNFQAFFWLRDFLNPLRGWPWFCFVSHKASRWFSPLFALLALLSCAMLAALSASPVYQALTLASAIFILLGLSWRVLPRRLTGNMYYFLVMNAALIVGLARYLRGIRSAAWDRTQRR